MIATALAGLARLISGASVEWRCDPDSDAQRIYYGNHSSHLDFIVIWSALPVRQRALVRPVAGRDYWSRGVVRRFLSSQVFHAALIERGRGGSADRAGSARAAVQQIADAMGERNSLIVFPEGTRSLNGEVGPFKSGLYHLWRVRPNAELIPVYLHNLNRILPKGAMLPVPMRSRVVFGAPLRTNVDEDKQAFLARARDALIQLKT
jgi:1-acyl-sn-glycerol-3-phosphate acyltransferase